MRPKAWHILLSLIALLVGPLLMGCGKKGTEPEDELNVSNTNPHCGLVAGFVRNSGGENLEGATVSISPAPPARIQGAQRSEFLSSFMNYPNPFTSDTYFTYRLDVEAVQMVRIFVYNLRRELLREFPNAPTTKGPNKLYFDGLDLQGEVLPNGLYPCEVLALSEGDTARARIALSKSINIASQGGLQSYTVTTQSNGKYVSADVPLNILLQTTNVFSPQDTLSYPGNWPYAETTWELTHRFVISATKEGYAAAVDTATLTAGRVTRVDFTLK